MLKNVLFFEKSWKNRHSALKKLTIRTAIFDDNYDPQSLYDNKLYFRAIQQSGSHERHPSGRPRRTYNLLKFYFYDFVSCASELTTKTSW